MHHQQPNENHNKEKIEDEMERKEEKQKTKKEEKVFLVIDTHVENKRKVQV